MSARWSSEPRYFHGENVGLFVGSRCGQGMLEGVLTAEQRAIAVGIVLKHHRTPP
jgi:hypothetical protein